MSIYASILPFRSLMVTPILGLVTLCAGCHTARGNVRTRAAHDFQCDDSEVTVTNVAGTTYEAVGCGHSATYTCRESLSSNFLTNETVCLHDDGASEPVASKPDNNTAREQPSKQSPPPKQAGGHRLGVDRAEAEQTCKDAGFDWTTANAKDATCSGLPEPISVPAQARLRFCGAKLCAIQLEFDTERVNGWGTRLAGLMAALKSKYGAAASSKVRMLRDCMETDIRPCLSAEDSQFDVAWRFPAGERIVLYMGPNRLSDEAKPGAYLLYLSVPPAASSHGL